MQCMFELKMEGFSVSDIQDKDIEDFIAIEKQTHYPYVAQHKDFFGAWNEDILRNAFELKNKMTFFKKILWNNETVGYLCYDHKTDQIDNVFIRIAEKAQNKGIGTQFLSYLKELSEEYCIPVFLVVIKTNPAQKLYEKLDFKRYKEQDVFYHYVYGTSGEC